MTRVIGRSLRCRPAPFWHAAAAAQGRAGQFALSGRARRCYAAAMADASLLLLADDDARSAWLRLRTLILLRWLAVLGQTAAVLVADLGLGLRIPLGLCAHRDRRLGASSTS